MERWETARVKAAGMPETTAACWLQVRLRANPFSGWPPGFQRSPLLVIAPLVHPLGLNLLQVTFGGLFAGAIEVG